MLLHGLCRRRCLLHELPLHLHGRGLLNGLPLHLRGRSLVPHPLLHLRLEILHGLEVHGGLRGLLGCGILFTQSMDSRAQSRRIGVVVEGIDHVLEHVVPDVVPLQCLQGSEDGGNALALHLDNRSGPLLGLLLGDDGRGRLLLGRRLLLELLLLALGWLLLESLPLLLALGWLLLESLSLLLELLLALGRLLLELLLRRRGLLALALGRWGGGHLENRFYGARAHLGLADLQSPLLADCPLQGNVGRHGGLLR